MVAVQDKYQRSQQLMHTLHSYSTWNRAACYWPCHYENSHANYIDNNEAKVYLQLSPILSYVVYLLFSYITEI